MTYHGPEAKGLPTLKQVERGTLVTFPTLRTSDSYTLLRIVGEKAEIERSDGRAMGVPAATPCKPVPDHDCWDHASRYEGDGPIGHGYTCAICGRLLQVG